MIQKYTRRSEKEWLKLIQECRTSGKNDKDWCKEHAISVSTFYNKITKLRKKACDIPKTHAHTVHQAQQVVPLEIIDESPVAYKSQEHINISNEIPAVALTINSYRSEITNHAAKGH